MSSCHRRRGHTIKQLGMTRVASCGGAIVSCIPQLVLDAQYWYHLNEWSRCIRSCKKVSTAHFLYAHIIIAAKPAAIIDAVIYTTYTE